MWDGVEFVELELVVRPNVDVGALVLGHITVFGRRENWRAQPLAPGQGEQNIN